MKKLLFILFFVLLTVFFPGKTLAQEEPMGFQTETLEGEIMRIVEEEIEETSFPGQAFQKLEVAVTNGSLSGRNIIVENGSVSSVNTPKFTPGDRVIVSYSKDINGDDFFIIADFVRRESLLWLFVLFSLLSIIVAGVYGFTSLLGMAYSFLIIFKFMLPRIVSGYDPILTAIIGSLFIIPVTFLLSHGAKAKTYLAGIGTLISLVIVGILAGFFVSKSRLTGYSAEEALFLQFDMGNVLNMKGILLAGIIVASLGVLDDVTISQASVVKELKEANKKLKFKELFIKAMNVGRDHIASMINTLVLVYTGASFPLLLLFINNPRPFSELVNYEIIAEEIVRTLVGSIGLILAVPITTLIAALYYKKSFSGGNK